MTTGMTRKDFCSSALGATLLLLIESCGGGGSSYSAGTGTVAGCGNTIALNHGHVLTIALADLDSPTDTTYNIQGSADHNHTVTLTVAQLRTLKTGASISTVSSITVSPTTGSHQHDIVITCM
jgi:hypothetical protein